MNLKYQEDIRAKENKMFGRKKKSRHLQSLQVASVCAHFSPSFCWCSICSSGNSTDSWGWNCGVPGAFCLLLA